VLASDPPGLYAEVAGEPDIEEASWLALLIVYLGTLDDADDPFVTIRELRTSWSSGELPDIAGAQLGRRSSAVAVRGDEMLLAYRRWVERHFSPIRAGPRRSASSACSNAWRCRPSTGARASTCS
jgi:hypothetical protein